MFVPFPTAKISTFGLPNPSLLANSITMNLNSRAHGWFITDDKDSDCIGSGRKFRPACPVNIHRLNYYLPVNFAQFTLPKVPRPTLALLGLRSPNPITTRNTPSELTRSFHRQKLDIQGIFSRSWHMYIPNRHATLSAKLGVMIACLARSSPSLGIT